MEQRLRLVPASPVRSEKRTADRRRIAVPGQIVWKDAKGTTRMAAVVTRDVSDHGVSVDCLGGMPIPLFRLVYFQVDREARNRMDLPASLRKSSVLSAIFRVGPCRQATGAPSEYALRILVEPERVASTAPVVERGHARPAPPDAGGARPRRRARLVVSAAPAHRAELPARSTPPRGVRPCRGRRPSPTDSVATPSAGTLSDVLIRTLRRHSISGRPPRAPDSRGPMIDRRQFVQSMLVLGAATGVRPAHGAPGVSARGRDARSRRRRAVGGAPRRRELRRHPHQPLSQPVHLHARPAGAEHRQHRGLRLRRPGDCRRHVGVRQQQQRDQGGDRPRGGAGGGDRPGQQGDQRRAGAAGAGRGLQRRRGTRRSRRIRSRCRSSPSSICCCRSTTRR